MNAECVDYEQKMPCRLGKSEAAEGVVRRGVDKKLHRET
jgi:hypothetical protein